MTTKKNGEVVGAPIAPNSPPAWLGETAQGVWTRTAAALAEDRVYDPRFDDLLGAYCGAMGAIIDASARGETPQASLLSQVRQLAATLGVDPASRARMIYAREREEWLSEFPTLDGSDFSRG